MQALIFPEAVLCNPHDRALPAGSFSGARGPTADGIIFIHHGLKFIALKHRAFARDQLAAGAWQHELRVKNAQKARLIHHGLGEIELIGPVVFSLHPSLHGLYCSL